MFEAPDDLALSKDQRAPAGDGDRHQLARLVHSEVLRRIVRGAYLPSATWESLSSRERYALRSAAVGMTRRSRAVLSHWSAAALHGLPIFGRWPGPVHLTVSPTSATRSRGAIMRHAAHLGDADVIEIDGVLVTSLTRTVLDMAAVADFTTAVMIADRAILVDRYGKTPPLMTREELQIAWEKAQPFRAHARTKAVFTFAECHAETPLESVSRVTMRTIGVPRPELQVPYYDSDGFIAETDFSWPGLATIGEADGDIKYLDSAYRSGRSAEQVVLDEKIREDRLRATGQNVIRWRWATAANPAALRRKLLAAGLTIGHKW